MIIPNTPALDLDGVLSLHGNDPYRTARVRGVIFRPEDFSPDTVCAAEVMRFLTEDRPFGRVLLKVPDSHSPGSDAWLLPCGRGDDSRGCGAFGAVLRQRLVVRESFGR